MVIEAWRPYRPSPRFAYSEAANRTLDTRSPHKFGVAAPEAGHRTIGKPIELTPGSIKVRTGAAARRGPMSARSRVRSLANRDTAGWVS